MVALGKGKTSEVPVKTQFGFHIIRVDDVRDAQLPKIEEVKPQIVQQLMQQKSSAYIEELRAKARIE
jgi:peptidyl-prolyl cis-trans isomerase C